MDALPENLYFLVKGICLSGIGVSDGMAALIDACHRVAPHPVWSELGHVDLEADVAGLQDWLNTVLVQQPPPEAVQAFYFGLAEFHDQETGGSICMLELAGAGAFDPQDPSCEWAVGPTYVAPSYGESAVLKAIYRTVQPATEEVRAVGEYVLALGYAGLAARRICAESRTALLGGKAWRAVAVGFNDGDALLLGRLTGSGWIQDNS